MIGLFCFGLLSGRVECNGGVAEEDEGEVALTQEPAADQEVPRDPVLPEQSLGEFDFNEFFNLDKVPCLASVSVDGATVWLHLTSAFKRPLFKVLCY